MHAYEGWVGKTLYFILPCLSLNCLNVAFFGYLEAYSNIGQLIVKCLENQLNIPLIGFCWNMCRIDEYEHDNECGKEICYLCWRMRILWHDES